MRHSPGVMPLTLAPAGRSRDLTFPEMLTLRLVKGFRDARLGLRTIKRVAEVAAADYGAALPFVTRRFRTDGRRISSSCSMRRRRTMNRACRGVSAN